MVVIQEIQTFWTKSSRGAPGAAVRNAVPEHLAFPQIPEGASVLEHHVFYSEHDGFAECGSVTSYEEPDSLRYGCVRLDFSVGRVTAVWRYESGYIGAPARDGTHKQAFILDVGQGGQVRYNGRQAEEKGWRYRKVVLNIGIFDAATGQEFLNRAPDFTYNQMASLL